MIQLRRAVLRDQLKLVLQMSLRAARTGRTTMIATAARELDVPVLVLSGGHGVHIEALVRGVKTVSINQPSFLQVKTFVMDNCTIDRLLEDSLRTIEELLEENRKLREKSL